MVTDDTGSMTAMRSWVILRSRGASSSKFGKTSLSEWE